MPILFGTSNLCFTVAAIVFRANTHFAEKKRVVKLRPVGSSRIIEVSYYDKGDLAVLAKEAFLLSRTNQAVLVSAL